MKDKKMKDKEMKELIKDYKATTREDIVEYRFEEVDGEVEFVSDSPRENALQAIYKKLKESKDE